MIDRMDRPTIAVYDAEASAWRDRGRSRLAQGRRLAAWTAEGVDGPVADLGCGPGWLIGDLGPHAVALDASSAMLELTGDEAPGVPRIRASVDALPLRTATLAAALASKVHVHLARTAVPAALADLHRALRPGARLGLHLFGGDADLTSLAGDDFPGRRFSYWTRELLLDVLEGAGFDVAWIDDLPTSRDGISDHLVGAVRARTLPDTVAPGLRLLVCGLNPSLHAADAGVGFHTANNRFWPAALAAGVVSRVRDPFHALSVDQVGMTDLVKRATPRASELTSEEYRDGMRRLERLCAWLQPAAVCVVGLAGCARRSTVERRPVPNRCASAADPCT